MGQKWGHLCTKPLKPGDYLPTLEFSSHLKHLLSALTHMGAESTTGGLWFTFSLFVLRHWRGMQGARPVSLPRGAFRELTLLAFSTGMLQSCKAPTAASEWHLVLSCCTAVHQHLPAVSLLCHGLAQISPRAAQKTGWRTRSWTTSKITGLP